MSKPILGNGAALRDPRDPELIQRLDVSVLKNHAIGLGSTKDGTSAGKLNAVYALVDLTGVPDLLNVDVSHALGVVPTLCELVEVENTGSSVFAQARPVSKDKWTTTNCRVAVSLSGAQSGTVLKFRVGGA